MPASPCPEDANVLSTCVHASLARYFQDLGEGAAPRDLWQMVMGCTERALLQAVMAHADHNQTRAADMLGITRNTLRKKLLAHQLTTGQSANLAIDGEVKRGNPCSEPEAPLTCGGDAPTDRSEFFTPPISSS